MASRVSSDSRRVEKVYSALARVYDAAFDWALGPGRRRALETLEAGPGERILEVGVGTGLSLPFYPSGCRITGIDIAEPMLEQARRRAKLLGKPHVELQRMDARALDFADETFDKVIAPYVMSVVPEPGCVMREIRRVCRIGGRVVVVNQFQSSRGPLRAVERVATPASQWVGFRLDLPLGTITGTAGLATERVERVNMLGMWRLVVLRRVA